MTDLEMIKRCAELMGVELLANQPKTTERTALWLKPNNRNMDTPWYDPLTHDGQAMALVKKFQLNLGPDNQGRPPKEGWSVADYEGDGEIFDADLNRAIVQCVAAIK